jgi:uncharacterized membrane protein YebE (DUF533 family)
MSNARLNIVRAMAGMAWADGRMDKKEKEKLRVLAKRIGLDASQRSTVEGYLISRPSIEDLTFDELNEKERQAMFLMAVHYAFMDKRLRPGEKKVLDLLAQALDISAELRAQMEETVRAQKKK